MRKFFSRNGKLSKFVMGASAIVILATAGAAHAGSSQGLSGGLSGWSSTYQGVVSQQGGYGGAGVTLSNNGYTAIQLSGDLAASVTKTGNTNFSAMGASEASQLWNSAKTDGSSSFTGTAISFGHGSSASVSGQVSQGGVSVAGH